MNCFPDVWHTLSVSQPRVVVRSTVVCGVGDCSIDMRDKELQIDNVLIRELKQKRRWRKRIKDEAVKLGRVEVKAKESEEKRKDLRLKVAELGKSVEILFFLQMMTRRLG